MPALLHITPHDLGWIGAAFLAGMAAMGLWALVRGARAGRDRTG